MRYNKTFWDGLTPKQMANLLKSAPVVAGQWKKTKSVNRVIDDYLSETKVRYERPVVANELVCGKRAYVAEVYLSRHDKTWYWEIHDDYVNLRPGRAPHRAASFELAKAAVDKMLKKLGFILVNK